uniref:Uncharacterized protein n=1 Tax=Rhizophora mucronata TaxID=61149 RepID=A0A2P2QR25_RHIMU
MGGRFLTFNLINLFEGYSFWILALNAA